MKNPELLRRIDRFCAWHKVTRSWRLLQHLLFAVLGALSVYVLCDKVFCVGGSYRAAATGLAAAGLAALLIHFLCVARGRAHVSYLVDRSTGLKNLIASGLNVAGQGDEVAQAVVRRAEAALAARAPHRVLPLRVHPAGRWAGAPALLLGAALLLPPLDLLGRRARVEKAAAEKAEVRQGALKLAARLSSLEKRAEATRRGEAAKIAADFSELSADLTGLAKRDALLKLGEFENRYRQEFSEQRDFEQAARGLSRRPNMEGLPPASRDSLKNLTESLKSADFGRAAEALRDLAKQLESRTLSPDEKKALARELARLADPLRGGLLGENLADRLRWIEASPADLADLLRQCEDAGRSLEDLARFCEECDGLREMREGLREAKQAMLGDSFSGFDAKEVEAYLRSGASLGCRGDGPGTGGEGRGRGGRPLENKTETEFKSQLSPSRINKGRILHQLFVSGVPEKGDAPAEYAEVIQAARQHAASSLARDQVPREYEAMVKAYFDSLEVGTPAGEPAP